ncbi:MAG: YHS domain-containing (seleno)protein [Bacteroidales bacterium]
MNKLIIILLLSFSFGLHAQNLTEKQRVDNFNIKSGLAIKGYDPVAYFTDNKAEKGSKKYSYKYKGITYYFVSDEHLQMFKEDPEMYEPVYGGWCAYAMGKSGKKVSVNPETFKVLDGKLHLFYNAWGHNTLPLWEKNEAEYKKKADVNWQKYLK